MVLNSHSEQNGIEKSNNHQTQKTNRRIHANKAAFIKNHNNKFFSANTQQENYFHKVHAF